MNCQETIRKLLQSDIKELVDSDIKRKDFISLLAPSIEDYIFLIRRDYKSIPEIHITGLEKAKEVLVAYLAKEHHDEQLVLELESSFNRLRDSWYFLQDAMKNHPNELFDNETIQQNEE